MSTSTATPISSELNQESVDRFRFSDYFGPTVVFGFFIAVWYLLANVILPQQKRFLLPSPHRVLTEGFFVWHSGTRRGLYPILMSLWDSAKIALYLYSGSVKTTFLPV